MEPVTLKLREPIKFGAQDIFELIIRPPRAKDMRQFPVDTSTMKMGDLLDLIKRLSGQPSQVIDELGTADMMEATSVVAGFIGAVGPTAGSAS